nr:MAG TPA: hypothetical protein [Caudoviricetes sp.]
MGTKKTAPSPLRVWVQWLSQPVTARPPLVYGTPLRACLHQGSAPHSAPPRLAKLVSSGRVRVWLGLARVGPGGEADLSADAHKGKTKANSKIHLHPTLD